MKIESWASFSHLSVTIGSIKERQEKVSLLMQMATSTPQRDRTHYPKLVERLLSTPFAKLGLSKQASQNSQQKGQRVTPLAFLLAASLPR
jgi:hypothetical protein